MIHDPELDVAREKVMNLFEPGVTLSPRKVIELLTSEGIEEGLVRSANLALVNAGRLEITPSFELRMPSRTLVAVG